MKKAILYLMLAALFMGLFTACKGSQGSPAETGTVSYETNATDSPTESTQQTAPEDFVMTPTYLDDFGTQQGGYYSLTLPAQWTELAEYEVIPGDMYTYRVVFYSSADRQAGNGGHLFTLWLFPDGEDYSYLPSYQKLCSMEIIRLTGGDLVAVYPTDVQFDTTTVSVYQSLEADIPGILESITFMEDAIVTP